jgi:hypothetical protein
MEEKFEAGQIVDGLDASSFSDSDQDDAKLQV